MRPLPAGSITVDVGVVASMPTSVASAAPSQRGSRQWCVAGGLRPVGRGSEPAACSGPSGPPAGRRLLGCGAACGRDGAGRPCRDVLGGTLGGPAGSSQRHAGPSAAPARLPVPQGLGSGSAQQVKQPWRGGRLRPEGSLRLGGGPLPMQACSRVPARPRGRARTRRLPVRRRQVSGRRGWCRLVPGVGLARPLRRLPAATRTGVRRARPRGRPRLLRAAG